MHAVISQAGYSDLGPMKRHLRGVLQLKSNSCITVLVFSHQRKAPAAEIVVVSSPSLPRTRVGAYAVRFIDYGFWWEDTFIEAPVPW